MAPSDSKLSLYTRNRNNKSCGVLIYYRESSFSWIKLQCEIKEIHGTVCHRRDLWSDAATSAHACTTQTLQIDALIFSLKNSYALSQLYTCLHTFERRLFSRIKYVAIKMNYIQFAYQPLKCAVSTERIQPIKRLHIRWRGGATNIRTHRILIYCIFN